LALHRQPDEVRHRARGYPSQNPRTASFDAAAVLDTYLASGDRSPERLTESLSAFQVPAALLG
jgi:hypothetical protein